MFIPDFKQVFGIDVWGINYINSSARKKRRIQAKQGKLLTKQGRKRSV